MTALPELDRGDLVVTYTVAIAENGDVINDTITHGRSFAEVYHAFLAIKAEVERQIAERRNCPFNPKYGGGEESLLELSA